MANPSLARPFFSLWSSAVAADGDGELVLCVHPISSSSWVMRFFLGGRTRNPLFHRQARYLQVPSINVLSRARLNLSLSLSRLSPFFSLFFFFFPLASRSIPNAFSSQIGTMPLVSTTLNPRAAPAVYTKKKKKNFFFVWWRVCRSWNDMQMKKDKKKTTFRMQRAGNTRNIYVSISRLALYSTRAKLGNMVGSRRLARHPVLFESWENAKDKMRNYNGRQHRQRFTFTRIWTMST